MHILTSKASLANHFIAELRHKEVQQDPWRFRQNLERLGFSMALQMSASLPFDNVDIPTPLGSSSMQVCKHRVVLATILRAGLPFYEGFLKAFDKAESAFIGAFRNEESQGDLTIQMDYFASPGLEGKVLIMTDPMLATGKSLVDSWKALLQYGRPARLFIATAIASKPGLQYVQAQIPEAEIWAGDVDPELDDKNYIVPGLGDAGDRLFGTI